MKERIREVLSRRQKLVILPGNDDQRRRAAVLIPIFSRAGEYHILFTKRTEMVMYHKGQVSFPGGSCDEADSCLCDTALRESFEEIGLRPEDVEILGELDDIVTLTSNYIVSPFVGFIPYPYDFKVCSEEIEEVVEAPISTLLDRCNFREEPRFEDGVHYVSCFYDCGQHVIWGATARILRQFLDLVFGAESLRAQGQQRQASA